jgi:hypothetical protein
LPRRFTFTAGGAERLALLVGLGHRIALDPWIAEKDLVVADAVARIGGDEREKPRLGRQRKIERRAAVVGADPGGGLQFAVEKQKIIGAGLGRPATVADRRPKPRIDEREVLPDFSHVERDSRVGMEAEERVALGGVVDVAERRGKLAGHRAVADRVPAGLARFRNPLHE